MNINKLFKAAISFSFLSSTYAANAATIVDTDSDGLIEINSLDDLNEMRNSLNGASQRGSSAGCPNNVCWGYELTRDLDFDTNDNNLIDAGDWNGGQAWVPVGEANAPFAATFNGNGHTIGHLSISSPNSNRTRFGLFGTANNADIRNVGLLDANINVTVNDAYVATLVGLARSSTISGVYAQNATIITNNAQWTGGVAGYVYENSLIANSYFVGDISATSLAGGLVGGLYHYSLVENSYAKGSVTSNNVAGLVEYASDSGISNSYANMQLSGSVSAGGLVGHFLTTDAELDETHSSINNSYALGIITASSTSRGGLVAFVNTCDGHALLIKHSYANNIIHNHGNNYANLIGEVLNNSSISIVSSYWVKNPEGVVLETGGSPNTTGGQWLADMQCASSPVGSNCAQPNLFANWDSDAWDFGSTSQLPTLKFKSNFPWISTDTPGGNGDYESIARIVERKPEYTCASPTTFHAKEKNAPYVFQTKTPDVLRYFNTSQGLACVHADQTSGSCGNYEVSYLCSNNGVNNWTAWRSSDTPNGNGDYETHASGCAATPLAIKARIVSKSSIYYSPQQKLSTFALATGLTCLNSDNSGGCKDYEVRMSCEVVGDR
jgi:hypothetical protein